MAGGVEELIDMLYDMVQEAKNMPFNSEKCVLEKERVLELIEEIKARVPTEVSEAQMLVAARADYISGAKREAEAIKQVAEEEAKRLVSEQEIYRMAKQKSREIIASAEARSKELRRAANAYVDEIMKNTEDAIAEALNSVRQSRSRFRQSVGAAQQPAPAPAPAQKVE
ncbi:MAG: hypothetical protein ACOX7P_07855 [Oscillospiraceae bacterium]|jgi:cell division septum initiation protein DivIVA